MALSTTDVGGPDLSLARTLAAMNDGERRDVLTVLQAAHQCAGGATTAAPPTPTALDTLCSALATAPPRAIGAIASVAISVPLR